MPQLMKFTQCLVHLFYHPYVIYYSLNFENSNQFLSVEPLYGRLCATNKLFIYCIRMLYAGTEIAVL